MTMDERTILFADLSGFTALTETHGDEIAVRIVLRFHEMARSCLQGNAVLVKTIGDEVMIVTRDARCAVDVALALEAAVSAEPAFPMVRAGLHTGPVTETDGDYFGNSVNLAARVTGQAKSGQILCTVTTAERLGSPPCCTVSSLGAVRLKNVHLEIELFALQRREAVERLFIDPVCRMHLSASAVACLLRHHGEIIYFCSDECRTAFEADHAEKSDR